MFKVLQYNVPGGKKNRGLALIASYRLFMAESELGPEKLRLAQIMGWCIEMVNTYYITHNVIFDTVTAFIICYHQKLKMNM